MIKKFIDNNKDNILNNICELIKIPSISDENSAENSMPFGKRCSDALNYILKLKKNLYKCKVTFIEFNTILWYYYTGEWYEFKNG